MALPPKEEMEHARLRHDPAYDGIFFVGVRTTGIFCRHFGLTFQAVQRARRMGVALETLQNGGDAWQVAFSPGYESSSGFRSAFGRQFGVTPKRSTNVTVILTQTVESPIGPMRLGATDRGICLVEFDDRRALSTEIKQLIQAVGPLVPGRNAHLDRMADELARYFAGTLTEFTVPLDIARGTPFQRQVWDRLLQVPFGETMSYGALAEAIGRPGAQRAVGAANGANGMAIVIPCHRVVRSDGHLGGYGGGPWRKQFLLDHEAKVCGQHRTLPLSLETTVRV